MAALMVQSGEGADSTSRSAIRARAISSSTRGGGYSHCGRWAGADGVAEMVKPGAVVIDVGVNRIDDPRAPKGYRLVGDVDFEGYGRWRRSSHRFRGASAR